jgi:hypothetical protein
MLVSLPLVFFWILRCLIYEMMLDQRPWKDGYLYMARICLAPLLYTTKSRAGACLLLVTRYVYAFRLDLKQ